MISLALSSLPDLNVQTNHIQEFFQQLQSCVFFIAIVAAMLQAPVLWSVKTFQQLPRRGGEAIPAGYAIPRNLKRTTNRGIKHACASET